MSQPIRPQDRRDTRIFLFALLLAVMTLSSATQSAAAQTTPYFEETECMFETLFPGQIDAKTRCGYVTVPELRQSAASTGATIRLAVVILGATGDEPRPDPLFMAQGGPGGSTIETYSLLLVAHPLRSERDIVLFDQRGTHYSEPKLTCTEMQESLPELLTLEADALATRTLELMQQCHTRLTNEGINLAAFNSLENAADVEDIRQALGYEQINFYGVSYGTLLGLHLMRDHPQQLRSVILDGVVPPQTNFIPNIFQNQQRVFDEFFSTCEQSSECNAQYSNLEGRFFRLVAALNESPQTLVLTHPDTGAQYSVPLRGDDLIDLTYQLFYISGSVGLLPKVIADAETGDFTYLELIYAVLVFDDTFSDGMYYSVICAEDADFSPSEVQLEGIRPEFSENAAQTLQEYLDICALWQTPPLASTVDDPVASDIPTLLLSGRYDPITPPEFAAIAEETLANATAVTAPTGGHGVGVLVDLCIDAIVADFLNDPQSTPSLACLDHVEPFTYAPVDVTPIPLLGQLNMLGDIAVRHVTIAALLLLAVTSSMVVWPAGFIWRRLRNAPRRMDPRAARLIRHARWSLFGFLAFVLLFLLALGGVFFFFTFPNQSMLLLTAVPDWSLPIFVIPWISALLAAASGWYALQLWVRNAGPLRGRVYYSILALCAIGYVIILWLDGILTILF